MTGLGMPDSESVAGSGGKADKRDTPGYRWNEGEGISRWPPKVNCRNGETSHDEASRNCSCD
jgi:hypothetical protein